MKILRMFTSLNNPMEAGVFVGNIQVNTNETAQINIFINESLFISNNFVSKGMDRMLKFGQGD